MTVSPIMSTRRYALQFFDTLVWRWFSFPFRSFTGYAKTSDYVAKAAELHQAITNSSAILGDSWITMGYDSPFKFLDRRNEVAFIAK